MTDTTAEQPVDKPYPAAMAAWGLVILLTLAYILSFVDRYILGLLAEEIKADFGITDTQIALLIGPAFAFFYATMGLPFGWLADRKRRTWIVGIGIAVWSLATVACGLARNYLTLFLARMGVGIGEATLGPCAMSMIADSFPKEKRGKPIAFYTMAQSLGAAGAFFIGALVLAWARETDAVAVPVLGDLAGWQFIFVAVGFPGLLLAAAFFLVKEPHRRLETQTEAGSNVSIPDMLRYVFGKFSLFGPYLSIFCCMTILAYAQGLLPSMFVRTYEWQPEKYALVNAIVLLATAPLTVNLAGWFSDRQTKTGDDTAPLKLAIVGLLLLVSTSVLFPLMPTGELAFAFLVVNTIGLALISAVGVIGLLNIVPSTMRGQCVALYYMTISLTGLFIGPTSIGMLSDLVFGNENIRYAFTAQALIFGIPVIALMPYLLKRYKAEVAALEGRG